MSMGLTTREAECLQLIERSIADRGVAPTLSEIADAMQCKTKSNVHRILSGLEAKGRIRRLQLQARAIEILSGAIRCPHCGNVAGSSACQSAAKSETPPELRKPGISPGADQAPGVVWRRGLPFPEAGR